MDKLILEAAIEYQRSMRLIGRNFKFPNALDVTATYPYRAIQAFVNKCRLNHFDDDMTKETIKVIVRYAKEHNLLNSGPSILNRTDIVDVCCKMLNKELQDRDYLADQLFKMNSFINSQTNDRTQFFSHRPKRKGYPNLIALRSNNTITDAFICLSKSAVTVLNGLECSERAVISSLLDLAKMRMRIITRVGKEDIMSAFGDDSNV